LLVDELAHENYQILDAGPLSATGFTEYRSTFSRRDWRVTAVTRTRLSTEEIASGQFVFRYEADAQAFIGDELFEEKHIEGTIPPHLGVSAYLKPSIAQEPTRMPMMRLVPRQVVGAGE
jgi:hypothetical protein